MRENGDLRILEEALKKYREVITTKDIPKPVVIGSFKMTEQEEKRLEKTWRH